MTNKNIILDISVLSTCTIQQAMQAIGRGEIGATFVTNSKGKFQRVLTDGDIRRALLEGHGLQSNINVIPFKEAIVAHESNSIEEISQLFSDKIRLIPVLDSEQKVIDFHLYDKRRHIAVAKPLLDDEELQLVSECIITGWVSSGGPFVTKFEELMADSTNCQYAVACSSATTGLHLSLLAAGVGEGDEVIVPSLTFISTANAVTYTGAKPVFVDVDKSTWNICLAQIRGSITKKTKAIIPVHLYGHPAEMDGINAIAKEFNLVVIEDVAEAQGSTYKNQPTGSLGNMGVYSFFGNKIITTGEGGMIVTNNKEFADKCRLLRDHGMTPEKRYWHEVIGYNYRMTNLQAAIGVAQMSKLENILERKKDIASKYKQYLGNLPGITLPVELPHVSNVYWLYTILIDPDIAGISAENLMLQLREVKIDSRPVFPPVHKQPVYNTGQSLPNSEYISSTGLSLPSSPELRDIDIEKICSTIKQSINY